MSFLYLLAAIRTPFLDTIVQLITHLGSEMLFIVVGIFMLWCMDKKQGYFILLTGFFGVYLNQFLKLLCRVPRPWVLDPNFTIVESARADATGYSFPSGHTQTAVGLYASIALCRKERWIRVLCVCICLLVPFSRMYLGVHTPLDVGVAMLMATALSFGLWFLFGKFGYTRRLMFPLLSSLSLMAVAFLLYTLLWPFPADIDVANLSSAQQNACTLLGALLGLWVTYVFDEFVRPFDTRAPLLGQILKLSLGLAIVLGIMEGSKPLFNLIFGEGDLLARVIRYFLTVLFAGVIWPMTFPFFAKVGGKKA